VSSGVPIRPDLFVDGDPPRLVGSRDRETAQVFFPAEAMNPVTMTEGTLERHEFDGGGTLVAWTVIGRGLPGFDSPYALGAVQLDAGPGFIGQLHDWQDKVLAPGMRVKLAIARIKAEKDGTEVIGPKFVPLQG
jgi:scaffold protein (connect acetoacetyl-CoA thiolase and HMG-CoA synthase)